MRKQARVHAFAHAPLHLHVRACAWVYCCVCAGVCKRVRSRATIRPKNTGTVPVDVLHVEEIMHIFPKRAGFVKKVRVLNLLGA